MIQLTCSNCRALLVMDDAFAGGVCRCKHCGTIQTVPKPSRRQSTPGSGGGGGANPSTTDTGQSKTLFQRPGSAEPLPGSGTGLDELASIVASSGMSGTALQPGQKQRPKSLAAPASPDAEKRRKTILLVSLIAGAMLVSAGITWLAVRNPGSTQSADNRGGPPTTPGAGTNGPGTPTAAKPPSFLGLPLMGNSIVYVLDRGSGTQGTFDLMKEAAFKSLETLPADTRFQVIFWETDNTARAPGQARQGVVVAFPTDTPKPATPANVAAARDNLKDVPAFGQSRILPAMEKAFSANPDTILVATGKYGLEEDTVGAVMNLRKSSSARIHTFSLGESASPEVLKSLAERAGGQFKPLTLFDLRHFAE